MRWVGFFVASLVVVGCSSSTPATTPTSIPTTATTTTLATTTTVDRVAEIEAIYQDLEERRLDALYRGDEEAFAATHVDNGYLAQSMAVFDLAEFEVLPEVLVEVVTVIHDGEECIAAETVTTRVDRQAASEPTVEVLELRDGVWLISYVGTGWKCNGPHPLDT